MAIDLSQLNDQQRDAIYESIDNNVALFAGAGSGKTFTITKRTEYLIDELGVKPESIMMITFTNKAAKEILERVSKVTNDSYKMWIGTFHGICVRILRKFGHYMGIRYFSIIDEDESKKMIKNICSDLGIEVENGTLKRYKGKISDYKSSLIKPEEVLSRCSQGNQDELRIASIYREYQNKCWREKSFDFDDLIIYTIMLLSSYKDVRDWIYNNIKYVVADEVQDTSTNQFQLIKLLVGDNNLMIVGDVNQSIYGFRNARPEYLNSFCSLFPNSKVLKLETNYRSTKTIIRAANAVINNNKFGVKINMDTNNEYGERIGMKYLKGFIPNTNNEIAEAKWIASEIRMLVANKKNQYGDFAIIYRTNIQSKEIETILAQNAIPFVVVGSSSFWGSKEMRDMLAFCKIVFNPSDVISFKRVLSTVKGVGDGTIKKILKCMEDENLKINEILKTIDYKALKINQKSASEIDKLRILTNSGFNKCSDISNFVINNTGYADDLRLSIEEDAQHRLEVIDTVIKSFAEFEANGDDAASVIDQCSLMSDVKGSQKQEMDAVKLLSAHACKGLEFNTVFLSGAEEGLFPHFNAISRRSEKEIEEERRLFYVAMTRAEKKLYITACSCRKGNIVKVSRFVNEIPTNLTEDCF